MLLLLKYNGSKTVTNWPNLSVLLLEKQDNRYNQKRRNYAKSMDRKG